MDTTSGARLVRHVVSTVVLAAAAVVVAWQVLFTTPGMGVNRYTPGGVSRTPIVGSAVQTGRLPVMRVVSIQRDPLQPGASNAQ
jgi:hypothetical protein